MKECSWVAVKQDLVTLVCQRCGDTHKMSIALPAPTREYLAILNTAGDTFTENHADCKEPKQ